MSICDPRSLVSKLLQQLSVDERMEPVETWLIISVSTSLHQQPLLRLRGSEDWKLMDIEAVDGVGAVRFLRIWDWQVYHLLKGELVGVLGANWRVVDVP